MENPAIDAFEELNSALGLSADDKNIFKENQQKLRDEKSQSKVQVPDVAENREMTNLAKFMPMRKSPKDMAEMKRIREELLLKKSQSKIQNLNENPNPDPEDEIQHISIETLEGEKPKLASRSPSELFPTPSPILANQKLQNLMSVKKRTILRSPRKLKSKSIKNSTDCEKKPKKSKKKVSADKTEWSLGNPFGIQLGSFNIQDDSFPISVRGKQAFETLVIAHGMSYIKKIVKWTDIDINEILLSGTELYKTHENENSSRMDPITRNITIQKHALRITISEPKFVGKIMTTENRCIDLLQGLKMFFAHENAGILKSKNLDLYLKREKMIFVFDPRGRTVDGERNNADGEAALIVVPGIENLYHLVLNLSKIDVNAPFKISTIEAVKIIGNSPENPVVFEEDIERKCDYQSISENVAILSGNLSFNSKVFGKCANKQQLTTCIMALTYSKIDPPHCWSKKELDKVLRSGTKFYQDCLKDKYVSLKLRDIPSKFYVGENFTAEIVIIPNMLCGCEFERTHVFFDNSLYYNIGTAFASQMRSLLVQVGDTFYAVSRLKDADVYYLFDGYEKDLNGVFNPYIGCASVLMIATFDELCKTFIERLYKLNEAFGAPIKIHGLIVRNVKKIPQKSLKKRPKIKCEKIDGQKLARLDDFETLPESPSIVENVEMTSTHKDEELMAMKRPDEPIYKTITDLNSPSLVCEQTKVYEDIVRSIKKKNQEIMQEVMKAIPEKSEEIKAVMKSVRSDIMELLYEEPLPNECQGAAHESEAAAKVTDSQSKERVICKIDLTNEELCAKPVDQCHQLLVPSIEKFMTMSQEAEIPTEFQKLPDKTEIIQGTRNLFEIDHDMPNLSLIVAVSAILTSAKYSIASWTPEIVNFVLENAEKLTNGMKLKNRLDLFTNSDLLFTKIRMKNVLYTLRLLAVDHGIWEKLPEKIEGNLKLYDRFIISSFSGSFAVFKRWNFYYLFEGFPCTLFGYRSKNGFSSFMRFPDLKFLIKRIKKNYESVSDGERFIVHRLALDDSSKKKRKFRVAKKDDNDAQASSSEGDLTSAYLEDVKKPKLGTSLLPDNVEFEWKQNDGFVKGTFALENRIEEKKDEVKECHFISMYSIMYSIHHPIQEQNYRSIDIILENGLKIYNDLKDHRKDDRHLKNVIVDDTNYEIQIFEEPKALAPTENDLLTRLKRSLRTQKYTMIQFPNCCFAIAKKDPDNYFVFDAYPVIDYDTIDEDLLEKRTKQFESSGETPGNKNTGSENPEGTNQPNQTAGEQSTSVENQEEPQDEKERMIQLKGKMTDEEFFVFNLNKTVNEKNLANRAGWIRLPDLENVVKYLKNSLIWSETLKKFTIYNVRVLSFEKRKARRHAGYFILDNAAHQRFPLKDRDCKCVDEELPMESVEWVTNTKRLPWSRQFNCNFSGLERNTPTTKWKEFDIELENCLYSLWGKDHPNMMKFGRSAGKQHLGVAAMSLLMATCYPIDEWTSAVLDQINLYGTKYYEKSVDGNPELKVTKLAETFKIANFDFQIKVDSKLAGFFYDHRPEKLNLSKALEHFFLESEQTAGILQSGERFLAIGKSGRDYYMFDCQAFGTPLFLEGEGFTYLLRCCSLRVLLQCLIVTIGTTCHNVLFKLYGVDVQMASDVHLKKLEAMQASKTQKAPRDSTQVIIDSVEKEVLDEK